MDGVDTMDGMDITYHVKLLSVHIVHKVHKVHPAHHFQERLLYGGMYLHTLCHKRYG
jgi:hypothetical protein